jgi:hypothetical protein
MLNGIKDVLDRPSGVQSRIWSKYLDSEAELVKGKFKVIDDITKKTGEVTILLGAGVDAYINYRNDPNDITRITTDFCTDIAFSATSLGVSALADYGATTLTTTIAGSVVPGVGNVVGFVAGTGFVIFTETYKGKDGKPIKQEIKDWIYSKTDKLEKTGSTDLGKFAKNISKKK